MGNGCVLFFKVIRPSRYTSAINAHIYTSGLNLADKYSSSLSGRPCRICDKSVINLARYGAIRHAKSIGNLHEHDAPTVHCEQYVEAYSSPRYCCCCYRTESRKSLPIIGLYFCVAGF